MPWDDLCRVLLGVGHVAGSVYILILGWHWSQHSHSMCQPCPRLNPGSCAHVPLVSRTEERWQRMFWRETKNTGWCCPLLASSVPLGGLPSIFFITTLHFSQTPCGRPESPCGLLFWVLWAPWYPSFTDHSYSTALCAVAVSRSYWESWFHFLLHITWPEKMQSRIRDSHLFLAREHLGDFLRKWLRTCLPNRNGGLILCWWTKIPMICNCHRLQWRPAQIKNK